MTTKTADAALMRLILKKQAAKPALLLNSVDIVACFLLIGNIKKGIPMTWILKYWKPLLGGVAVLAVICGEVQYGRARYQAGYAAATAAINAKLAGQKQKHQKTAHAASVEYQQEKSEADEKVRVRREVVRQIIERPVFTGDCVDASGVQVLNAAIAERH